MAVNYKWSEPGWVKHSVKLFKFCDDNVQCTAMSVYKNMVLQSTEIKLVVPDCLRQCLHSAHCLRQCLHSAHCKNFQGEFQVLILAADDVVNVSLTCHRYQ